MNDKSKTTMMKKIFNTVVAGLVLVAAMTSCTNDPAGLTQITYYPVFTLEGGINGGSVYTVPVGSTYADPGYSAVEGSEDVTNKVVVTIADINGDPVSSISTDKPTLYTVTYTAVNADGFSASATRTVFVYDPSVTTSMAGTYSTDMTETKYGANKTAFSAYAASYGNTDQCVGIEFTELAPGIYSVNDLFGGWYEQIRGYGNSYAMTGYVCLNADNTIDLMSSLVAGWGDSLDYIKNGKYDPATGKISYSLSYAGQIFIDIVLNKD